jgi:hypothetical protein
MNPWIGAALVLGIASSAHCLGMCGPIALAVPSLRRTWQGRLLDTMILNGGRVLTYSTMGAMFGAFGRGLMLAGLQRALSVLLGAAMLCMVLAPRLAPIAGPGGPLSRGLFRFRSFFAQRLGRVSPFGLFTSGMLNGLLPCGSVYMALAMALVQDGALHGAMFMFTFGIGTWPSLIVLRMGGGVIGQDARGTLRRMAPALTGLVAVLLILRGMGLGIPYVSPEIDTPPVVVQSCE